MPGLGNDGLHALQSAIRSLDPDGDVVSLDVDNRSVRYADAITSHERITRIAGEEEVVRAYIVAWLCTEGGYPLEAIELEKGYRFGRANDMQLDIRVARPDGTAWALIEVKSPDEFGDVDDPRIEGQLFAPAALEPGAEVLSLATVRVGEDLTPTIECVTIGYEGGLTFASWLVDKDHVDDFPVNYGAPTQEPLRNGGPRDLRTNVSRADLERLRMQLHNRLWGGSRDDNEIYAWLVRLFLTKILDEKVTNIGDTYTFQVMRTGSTKETEEATAARIAQRYEEAYRRFIDPAAAVVEPLDSGEFTSHETAWVAEMLQDISLTATGSRGGDLLGGFFEAITRDGFKQSKGLFFTHYNLAVFMVEAVDLPQLAEEQLTSAAHANDRLPYVIDPSCGSGTFLLAAMRSISNHIVGRRESLSRNRDVAEQLALRFPVESPNTWAKDFIYGIEKREDLSMSSTVNMVLHRDGHTHIFKDDGLAPLGDIASRHADERFRPSPSTSRYPHETAESFDVVLTNPPFSITLDDSVRASLADRFVLASNPNSENLFLERWYQLLRPGGRLAAVMPESFFSTTENLDARLFLFSHFQIRAVVSLPSHAFQPWTPTRTSLLFARKKTPEEEETWAKTYRSRLNKLSDLRARAFRSARAMLKVSTRAELGLAKRMSAQKKTELVAIAADTGIDSRVKKDDLVARMVQTINKDELVNALEAKETAMIASERDDVDAWLQESGLPPLPPDPSTADILAAIDHLKAVRPEIQAFRETVDANEATATYVGIKVDEIGFRRTKRAENSRPNNLFSAVGLDENAAEIRNLNDPPGPWKIVEGEDALSLLRQARIWE